jgi:hypothetical protein
MSREKFKYILIPIIAVVCGVLVMEMTVRIFVDETYWRFRDATTLWTTDSKLGWIQKPNQDFSIERNGKRIRFETDNFGFQVTGNASASVRILIVGDSTAVGRLVPNADRVHNVLHRELSQLGIDSLVVNAAVEGYSTDQSLVMLNGALPLVTPTIVFHIIADNDFYQNQNSVASDSLGLLKPTFQLVEGNLVKTVSEINNESIGRYGNIVTRNLQRSALYRLIWPVLFDFRQKLGLVPDLSKAKRSEPNFYQNFNYHLERVDWGLFSALVSEMDTVSRLAGAKFFVYRHPALEEVWPPYAKALGVDASRSNDLENYIQSLLHEIEVDYIPLIPHFRANLHRGPFHLLPADAHCNEAGYALQALHLKDVVVESTNAKVSTK